ncbi:MAG: hypothetical protein BGO29_14770 [Bacteroidales bacterium 36-12]|nr:MAG: hypothetical protein BGO29_14770 [Bacteroidales bacterium 36-12]
MIINVEDIRKVRPIAENVNDVKRLNPYIEEAEKLFLLPALGAKLYKKVEDAVSINNIGEPIIDNDGEIIITNLEYLFNGCYYDDDNRHCQGLKQAVGYLAYSRFVRNHNVNITAFGVVQKQGQFSEQVDEKTIIRTANDAEKIGVEYLNQCIEYINFDKCKKDKRGFKRNTKFKAIGK